MNIKGIKETLPTLLKHGVVPYLHGSHGLGKTQVVKQIATSLGIDFIPLYLSTQEVGDLIGLLRDRGDGTVSHTRPEWFPTDGKGIIFLDEFNRAHPDVLQAMLPFALEKTLHRHKLPEGWHIVCAGNYNSNNYSTTDISDSALISRFCHIDFKPTREEFIIYAEDNGAELIASFIRDHGAMLEEESKNEFDASKIKPNRRAWLDFVSKLEKEDLGENRFEVYSGIVGTTAASSFLTYKKNAEKSIDLNTILKSYSKVKNRILSVSGNKQEVRFDLLNQPVEELLQKLESKPSFLKESYLTNLKEFLQDIPNELSLKVFKRMGELKFNFKNEILNDPVFCNVIASKMKQGA